MNERLKLKADQHNQPFRANLFPGSGPLPLLKNNGKACERRKNLRGKYRAEFSNPKRTMEGQSGQKEHLLILENALFVHFGLPPKEDQGIL